MLPPYCYFLRYSRKYHMLRATIFCGLMLLMTSLRPISAGEGDTLIAIMQKWSNKNVLTWTPGTDHCTWAEVKCDGQNNVVSLNLTLAGLSGPVPEEMSSLKSLKILDLSENEITGDLAPLESLINLQVLNLTFNILGGGFPNAVLTLTELVDLRLDNLYLSGQFPTNWKTLKNLQYLYAGNNSMTGVFPSELTELSNLKELTLWGNSFNSALPPELGNLSNLTYLNVHSCSMWGHLPLEFSKLQNMEELHLYNNSFTGKVPSSWQNMINLKDLRLHINFLTGDKFPAWIPNHPKLSKMYLSYNRLYSPFPNLTDSKLQRARLECSYFTGPTPVPPLSITEFVSGGNCFTDQNNSDGTTICGRVTTCAGFMKNINEFGCPPCPLGQIFQNHTECICEPADTGTGGSSNDNIKIIVPIVIGLFLVLLISILIFLLSKGKGKRRRFHNFFMLKTDDGDWEAPMGVQRFTIEDIDKATNNFDANNEIGAGGFGKVFMGTMESGKKLAIKRASIASLQGSAEFRNEVMLLSRLHHRNLVRLEGFCEDDGLRILVYEFMANGNLHTLLFPKKGIRNILHWHKRLEISLDIAQGLDYLHSFADPPVIHRDIKPSNILLDENFIAKVADFGLSKATPEFETHLSTNPAGTAGFIDPQYFLRQQLTTASDVYGFGVVLLELITGQNAIDQSRTEDKNLVEWVNLMMKAEGIRAIVDPLLGPDYPEKIYKEFIDLALKCASFETEFRPKMKEIVAVLERLLQSSPSAPEISGTSISKKASFQMSRGKTGADAWNKYGFSDPSASQSLDTGKNVHLQLLPR